MTTETKDPLATLFCSMYGDTARATFALQRIGVGAEHLNPRQAAATFWREAFALVDRLGLLPRLVEHALADKSVAAFHGALRDAWEEREKAAQTDILATVLDDWTPARIAEALARVAATPEGPWGVFEQDCLCWITGPTRIIGDEGEMSRAVAAFIAAARTDLPSALRALTARAAEIERLRTEMLSDRGMYEAQIADLRNRLATKEPSR